MTSSIPLVTSLNTSKLSQEPKKHSGFKIDHSENPTQSKAIIRKSKNVSDSSFNDSSIYADPEGKAIVLLEESSKIQSFMRRGCFIFSIFFIFWFLYMIFLLNSNPNQRMMRNFLIYSSIISLILFFFNKIIMAIFDRKLRKWALYFFIFDIVLLGFILFGIRFCIDDLKKKHSIDYSEAIEFFIVFGIVGFINTTFFALSTLLESSNKFNTFIAFICMTVASAGIIFSLPSLKELEIIPSSFNASYEDLFYFFLFVIVFNIYFSMDLYLLITRMCHKLSEDDYFMVYFYFWSDWAYRFWINLFLRKRRIFDIEDKDVTDGEDEKAEVIEL